MKIFKHAAITGEIKIPPDKSITHRAIILGSLSDGIVTVDNYLAAADCLSTVACMEKLGVKIERSDKSLTIHGVGLRGLHAPTEILDAGNSGTTLRLLMGLMAAQPFQSTFTGDDSLKKRPLKRVIEPLSQMGATFSNSKLPLTVNGAKLRGIRYETAIASAQVKSAILLAALFAENPTQIIIPPCRDHTELMLKACGVRLDGLTIYPAENLLMPKNFSVPNDISSAAFWIVLATLIDGSELTLKNIGLNESRTGILDALRKMGGQIEIFNQRSELGEVCGDLTIKSAKLTGIEIKSDQIARLIDEIPILAVAAAFAEGITIIRGVGELRVKESDRLAAIVQEFNKLSPETFTAEGDTLIIHGNKPKNFATCQTYGDHRIAMALAIMGAAAHGVELDDAACVQISYPNFFAQLK